jgi:predicted dehydrogenase
MLRIKIIGAGSVGNHFSHAARQKGWSVVACDRDPAALRRMRESVYPGRYGAWDPAIETLEIGERGEMPRGDFDIIVVGTPPESHLEVAKDALAENPRILLIEKPALPPDPLALNQLMALADHTDTRMVVGYNHLLSPAVHTALGHLDACGNALSIDVAFREHWKGFFAAHPWLSGPADSYLGFTDRGGGAGGEHSHALSLWLFLAEAAHAGEVVSMQAFMDSVAEGGAQYDRVFRVFLQTQSGMSGSVVQDVVTWPAQKWARVQGSGGAVEIDFASESGVDLCTVNTLGDVGTKANTIRMRHPKTRPQEFVRELDHLEALLQNPTLPSPLDLSHGLAVIRLLIAAKKSAAEKRPLSRAEILAP